jgi:steroid delta-isomerase-like uncharacterized protein
MGEYKTAIWQKRRWRLTPTLIDRRASMPKADNATIARRFFDDVFTKGDLNTIDKIFARDYVGHSSANLGRPIKGRAGIRRFVSMYRKAFPDLEFAFEELLTLDDKVVARWTTRGTHEGELFGIAPTGRQMTVTGIGIAHIVNGQIRVSHSEVNMLSIAEQLGAVQAFG